MLSIYAEDLAGKWPSIFTLVPLVYAAGVIVQRRNEPHLGRTILLVAIAVIPLILDDRLRVRYPAVRRIPELVFSIPAFVAVFLLIWQPVEVDVAPFLLFLITVQATVTGETLDGIAVAVVSAGIVVASDIAGHYSGSLAWVLDIALAWSGGFAFRCLLNILAELKAAQAGLAQQAAADERRRIAREIHDVIAHSLSVAALHITGARMAVARGRGDALKALEDA